MVRDIGGLMRELMPDRQNSALDLVVGQFGEHLVAVVGDQNGVLVLGREAAVFGDHGPFVGQ